MSAVQDGQDVRWLRSEGFRDGASYDRARPAYPTDAIEFFRKTLQIRRGARLLDLGAGTGKLTSQLVGLKAEVTAVEPSDSMRAELARKLPTVDARPGSAERIPISAASFDVVLVAQSFHWFEPDRALREIARVLRSPGSLGLVWNERDESVGWVRELSDAMGWHQHQPYRVGMDFRPLVTRCGLFGEARRRQFKFHQVLGRAGLLARVASTSYIAALEPTERERALEPARDLIADLPEPIRLPYVTDLYTFRALKR